MARGIYDRSKISHKGWRKKALNYEKVITLQVTKKQYDSLKKTAEKENITMSEVVRRIINTRYGFKQLHKLNDK